MAAAFHSYTVGNSFCAKRAYARASYQLTPPTGSSSASVAGAPPSHDDGPRRPVLSTNVAIAASQATGLPSRTMVESHSSRLL
jgi:hypothetical protein